MTKDLAMLVKPEAVSYTHLEGNAPFSVDNVKFAEDELNVFESPSTSI